MVRTVPQNLHAAVHLLLTGLFALALLLTFQLPLHYTIDVGVEEGYGGDLPHLRAFNTPEDDEHGTYRWTRDKADIIIPGLGQRPLLLQLDFFPVSAQVIAQGPQVIELWIDEQPFATLPVQMHGAHYHLVVPARLMQSGSLKLTIRTATFSPPDDPRELGTPLDHITITSLEHSRPVIPDWSASGGWILAMLLFLLICRATVGGTLARHTQAVPPIVRDWSSRFVLGASLLVVLAAILDPPRWAFGAWPAFITLVACVLLALVLRVALPRLAAHLELPLDTRTLGWLLLLVLVAFGMRYGGRIYPNSMHGDIGFHRNRFNETTWGDIYLVSRNRGVNFPYPPGPYLVIAPLGLLHDDPPDLLELTSTLADALGMVLIYAIVVRSLSVAGTSRHIAQRLALLAAAIYGLTAAGFMTTWWSFDTHIYAQFFTLLLITALHQAATRIVPQSASRDWYPQRYDYALLGLLLSLVFLGHFGFLINTVFLGGLLIGLTWLAVWRGAVWAQCVRWPLTLTAIAAGCGALLFFYSAYIPMFLEQARITAESGLTGLAERAPVPRWYLWQVLWEAGIITHFGFFPLLLAPLSLGIASQWYRPLRVTLIMIGCSFLVSLVFALLPFITLSTQSTRWLMFSAWAVAIGAALVMGMLWHTGRAGRVVVLAMAGFVLWNTATLWLGPLAWRIRPPEPF